MILDIILFFLSFLFLFFQQHTFLPSFFLSFFLFSAFFLFSFAFFLFFFLLRYQFYYSFFCLPHYPFFIYSFFLYLFLYLFISMKQKNTYFQNLAKLISTPLLLNTTWFVQFKIIKRCCNQMHTWRNRMLYFHSKEIKSKVYRINL